MHVGTTEDGKVVWKEESVSAAGEKKESGKAEDEEHKKEGKDNEWFV